MTEYLCSSVLWSVFWLLVGMVGGYLVSELRRDTHR